MANKATPSEVRAFFEQGSRKVSAAEIMALKRNPVTKAEYDAPTPLDQIAQGIGDGSLTY